MFAYSFSVQVYSLSTSQCRTVIAYTCCHRRWTKEPVSLSPLPPPPFQRCRIISCTSLPLPVLEHTCRTDCTPVSSGMAHYTCDTYVTLSHPHSITTTSIYSIVYNPQRLLALLSIYMSISESRCRQELATPRGVRGVANSYLHLHSDILVIVSGHFCDQPGTQFSIPLYDETQGNNETQALSTENYLLWVQEEIDTNKRKRKQRRRRTEQRRRQTRRS